MFKGGVRGAPIIDIIGTYSGSRRYGVIASIPVYKAEG